MPQVHIYKLSYLPRCSSLNSVKDIPQDRRHLNLARSAILPSFPTRLALHSHTSLRFLHFNHLHSLSQPLPAQKMSQPTPFALCHSLSLPSPLNPRKRRPGNPLSLVTDRRVEEDKAEREGVDHGAKRRCGSPSPSMHQRRQHQYQPQQHADWYQQNAITPNADSPSSPSPTPPSAPSMRHRDLSSPISSVDGDAMFGEIPVENNSPSKNHLGMGPEAGDAWSYLPTARDGQGRNAMLGEIAGEEGPGEEQGEEDGGDVGDGDDGMDWSNDVPSETSGYRHCYNSDINGIRRQSSAHGHGVHAGLRSPHHMVWFRDPSLEMGEEEEQGGFLMLPSQVAIARRWMN